MHLHTLEDRDAEALQEHGWRSRTRGNSDDGRFQSKRRTTAPPGSTHVQPGDVSRALIQQGGGRGWGRQLQQQHDGVVVMEQRGFQQGFTKNYEVRGCGEVGLRRERERFVSLAAPKPPLYIGGGEVAAPPLGFPP